MQHSVAPCYIADHVYLSAMTIRCGCVSAINSLALALSLAIWKTSLKTPYYILDISTARRHFVSKFLLRRIHHSSSFVI